MGSPLDDFCGSPFWDYNKVWNTTDPDFTEYFHQTVLVWIPCTFLWLFSPIETYFLLYSKDLNIPWSSVNISKLVVNFLLIILAIVGIGHAVFQANSNVKVAAVYYVTPSILLITFVSIK